MSTVISGADHDQVGILGGTGPVATLHLHQRVIERALSRGARSDADFPQLIIASLALPDADATGAWSDEGISERVELLRSAGCSRLVSACNALAAHTDQVPSLPRAVLERCQGVKRLGVLCAASTREHRLYEDGRDVRYSEQDAVTELIELGMRAQSRPQALLALIEDLRALGCELIVLGCTELTVHYPAGGWPPDVIDSVDVACDLVMGV